ncbi:MAG: DUF1552 domain-containing protein [Myxococcales bacterium]|nr:DUF1552 domain-containing protein [Myxococcales bacterium]
MTNPSFGRRGLLGLGLAGGVAGGLSTLIPRAARAANDPKRLLVIFTSMGWLEEYFWPERRSDTDFGFGSNHANASWAPFKNQLIFPDGLNVYGMHYSMNQPDNEHGKGIKMIFTGAKTNNDSLFTAQGPSIDHVVAEKISAGTRFRNIVLGVATNSGKHSNAFWAGNGKPVQAEQDPGAAFNRLFANFNGGGSAPAPDTAKLEQLRLRKQSVIDMVRADLNRARAKLGASQIDKIDAHLDAVRSLETRVGGDVAVGGGAGCKKPATPNTSDKAGQIRAQMDTIVAAFACDLTRVAGLQIGHADGGPVPEADRHNIAHSTGGGSKSAAETYRKQDAWNAGHMLHLFQAMSAVKENNGSLLDNTLILFGTDTQGWMRGGGGVHASVRTPMFMVGGGNFAFKTGRHLVVNTGWKANDKNGSNDKTIPSHHRVLVAIAQKFGVDGNTFGNLDPGTGPLAGL